MSALRLAACLCGVFMLACMFARDMCSWLAERGFAARRLTGAYLRALLSVAAAAAAAAAVLRWAACVACAGVRRLAWGGRGGVR